MNEVPEKTLSEDGDALPEISPEQQEKEDLENLEIPGQEKEEELPAEEAPVGV